MSAVEGQALLAGNAVVAVPASGPDLDLELAELLRGCERIDVAFGPREIAMQSGAMLIWHELAERINQHFCQLAPSQNLHPLNGLDWYSNNPDWDLADTALAEVLDQLVADIEDLVMAELNRLVQTGASTCGYPAPTVFTWTTLWASPAPDPAGDALLGRALAHLQLPIHSRITVLLGGLPDVCLQAMGPCAPGCICGANAEGETR